MEEKISDVKDFIPDLKIFTPGEELCGGPRHQATITNLRSKIPLLLDTATNHST